MAWPRSCRAVANVREEEEGGRKAESDCSRAGLDRKPPIRANLSWIIVRRPCHPRASHPDASRCLGARCRSPLLHTLYLRETWRRTRIVVPHAEMVHLRLNDREANPNPHVNFITPLKMMDEAAEEEARQLLRALAAQVRPIMKTEGFVVNSLEEVSAEPGRAAGRG